MKNKNFIKNPKPSGNCYLKESIDYIKTLFISTHKRCHKPGYKKNKSPNYTPLALRMRQKKYTWDRLVVAYFI